MVPVSHSGRGNSSEDLCRTAPLPAGSRLSALLRVLRKGCGLQRSRSRAPLPLPTLGSASLPLGTAAALLASLGGEVLRASEQGGGTQGGGILKGVLEFGGLEDVG